MTDTNTKTTAILINRVSVIDMHSGETPVRDILIRGDLIEAVGPVGSLAVPKDARKVNGAGRYAIPGLWDAHIHMTLWPEYTRQLSTLLVANGITSVRDMGGQLDAVMALRQHNRQAHQVAPRMWVAGPIIDGAPAMAQGYGVEVTTEQQAIELVDSLAQAGVDFIKLYELLPPDLFRVLMQRAQQIHQLPAAGHIPQRMSIAEVLDIGQYDIQHLGGVGAGMKFDCVLTQHSMPDRSAILDNKSPQDSGIDLLFKVAEATEVSPEDMDQEKVTALIQRFARENTWHTPTLVTCVSFNDLGLLDDPFARDVIDYLPASRREAARAIQQPTADPTHVYRFGQWTMQVVRQMHQAGVKLLAGTDSPPLHTPAFCLHLELKALVAAGLSPLQVLQTATINPAEFFKLSDQLGTLEPGKFADMLLLDKNPLRAIENTRAIAAVFSRGQYLDRQALDKLLAAILASPAPTKTGP